MRRRRVLADALENAFFEGVDRRIEKAREVVPAFGRAHGPYRDG